MTPQQRYQLSHRQQGLCLFCCNPAVGVRCEKHRLAHNKNLKEWYLKAEVKGGINKKVLEGDVADLTKRQISRAKSWLRVRGLVE